jgi:D-alanine--poly(phosphoribitol) ligase subunit 1
MYQQLIERTSTAWSTPLLDHLSDHDRHRFQLFGQGPAAAVPDTHIHHAFERHAASRPDATAAEHHGETITYGELDRQANRLAARLAGHGVRPGDNVAVFVRRGIPMLVGILGVLKAGAAYVPQDAGLAPAAHLRHVIDAAATRVILTTSGVADRVPVPAGHHLIAIDALMSQRFDGFHPRRRAEPGENCYVLFTSGTTGRANGVAVTHRNVCNLLLTAPGNLGIRPGWRVGHLLNVAFDMAAWEILGCLSNGGTLVIRGQDIAETAERVDVVIATPTMLSGLDVDRCGPVKVVAVAGEPCPRPLADRWARRSAFYNGCGPTETTIVNTMQRHDPAAARLTIGRPTPNNTVYVLDPTGHPCPIGATGEMWAGGDCVSAGYLDNPALNAERYVPDPFLGGGRLMFRTRDLGRWTTDGQLEHLGRTDDQVKVRGFRVELDSVSAILESVPGCRRAVTLKLDDRSLVSFVSPSHVDPETAKRAVANALPYYCVPAAVYPLPVLPETSRGKIDKAALRHILELVA